MKKYFVAGFIVITFVTIWFYTRHPLGMKAIINGQPIRLELALTSSEKERGLGYRDALASDSGMLFVYQNKDRYGFWMKGMRFPLDFIWIDGNRVVELSEHIGAPATDTSRAVELSPKTPVDKVLEVNAGVIEKLGVRVGDIIQFID